MEAHLQMIRWREYLKILEEDGVYLDETEEEILGEDGRRVTTEFLYRNVGDNVYSYPMDLHDLEAPVSEATQRRVASHLRLPTEKYGKPLWPMHPRGVEWSRMSQSNQPDSAKCRGRKDINQLAEPIVD
jgi:hypothetical protein